MQDTPDLYATLQVHHLAEPEVIEAAYHRLARMYHPDLNKSVDAAVKMTLLNLAYDVLGDPDKRAEYDRQRGYQQGMAQPGPSRNAEGRRSADANATKADATTRKVGTSMEVAKRSGRYEIVEIPLRNPPTRQSGNQQERAQSEPKRGSKIRLPKDVNATDADGRTELHTRAVLGHIDMVQALIAAGADVNAEDDDGATPLHLAAFRGRLEVVNALIYAGADVDARIDAWKNFFKDHYESTPLHYAAMRGHVEVVNALVSARANFDLTSRDDNTPIHKAADNGHVEVVNALISAGADVDAKGRYGRTPLHYAASKGHVEVVKALIAAGADMDAKDDDDGTTPLHLGALHERLEVVNALISAGANVDSEDDDGDTPLDTAELFDHDDIAEMIRRNRRKRKRF